MSDKSKRSSTPSNLVNITNVVDSNTIKLYGYVGPWQDIDWAPFEQAFRPMDRPENTITIRVNCYGGNVFSGLAIFDLVKNAQATIIVINEGVAASMGGVFMQFASAGKRKATKNSRIMIHKVAGACRGEAETLREYANMMDEEEKKIIELYVEATGKTEKEVKGWFKSNSEKWFSAKQALEVGLIDEIIEGGASNSLPTNIIKSENPEAIWNFYNETSNDTQIFTMNKYQIAILALLANAGIAQTPAQNATDEQWIEALNNATNAIKNKATEAENKLKLINESRAKDLVAGLKAAGKLSAEITPDQERTIVEQATSNYDVVSMMFGAVQNTAHIANGATPTAQTADINSFLNNGGVKQPLNNSGIPEDRKSWDITKWAKEDAKGLQALAKSHPKEYQSLLNAVENDLIENGHKHIDG